MSEDHPGWFADPTRNHELRFFDGTTWTDLVVDHGVHSLNPLVDTVGVDHAAAPVTSRPQAVPTGRPGANGATAAMLGPVPGVPTPPAFRALPATGPATAVPPPLPPFDSSTPPRGIFPDPPMRNGAPRTIRTPPPPERPPPAQAPRSWRSWQVVTAVAVALLLGLLIGRATKSGTRAAAGTTSVTTRTPQVLGGAAPSPTSSTTVAAIPAGKTLTSKGAGDSTSEPFNFPGAWQVAWTYSCPKGTGPFQLRVDGANGLPVPGGPLVDSSGASGKGTEQFPGGDNLILKLTTPCSWTVKLSG